MEIPKHEKGKVWMLNDDGSAVPMQEDEGDLSYDYVDEDYDAVHPEYKEKKYKAVYKQGGPRRTQ